MLASERSQAGNAPASDVSPRYVLVRVRTRKAARAASVGTTQSTEADITPDVVTRLAGRVLI